MQRVYHNVVPISLVYETEGKILAFGFVHKRSGNKIRSITDIRMLGALSPGSL